MRSLRSVLDDEATAARAADVDRLAELQVEKRAMIDALDPTSLKADELDDLARRAASNVALIRVLAASLAAFAPDPGPRVYGRSGDLTTKPHGTSIAPRARA